jgi:hypothetical protein
MDFTKAWDRNWIGTSMTVYLSNKKKYSGTLCDFGENFVLIDKIMFNPAHIVSVSEWIIQEYKWNMDRTASKQPSN